MQPNQYRDARLEKLGKLKALGLEVWPRKAKRTHGLAELAATYGDAEAWPNEKLEALGLSVSVMGRVLTIREMGKSVFAHLSENGEKLQAFFR
ncbi:MAG TPA: lysine--tRNA ligase, partial [Holophagaceae bacterium]